ncbi:hypothetical protein PGT21_012350 [Puccinia graminis f. sp. tritici]|uniref:Uncharacterized protein n=1 Tax=Puccinia graminis f. sp. tritici TaxID=56615 RepID=A0A5B0MEK3_PUCGR|nr:hypothetical protein PGT21_012350 [Puccinia graminis f. sp. tritici]
MSNEGPRYNLKDKSNGNNRSDVNKSNSRCAPNALVVNLLDPDAMFKKLIIKRSSNKTTRSDRSWNSASSSPWVVLLTPINFSAIRLLTILELLLTQLPMILELSNYPSPPLSIGF